MARRTEDVTMEGVQIRIRNFSGKEGRYNPKGQRNFLALVPDEIATQMENDGWNIKELKPKEEGDPPQKFLKVKVNIDSDPMPRLVLVTSRGKTRLDATDESMTVLDWSDVIEADLIVNPYHWNVDGNSGITAYLRAGYFKIREDDLDLKYADTPDTESAKSTVHFEPNDEPF